MEKKPKTCDQCETEIKRHVFCSRKCSQDFFNANRTLSRLRGIILHKEIQEEPKEETKEYNKETDATIN